MNDHKSANHLFICLFTSVCVCVLYLLVYIYLYIIYTNIYEASILYIYIYMRHILDSTGGRKDLS